MNALTHDALLAQADKVLLNNYGRLPFTVDRAAGSSLWDLEGRKYLDLFPGFGACGIGGHCHPVIAKAVVDQMSKVTAHGNLFHSAPQTLLAEKLIQHSFQGKVFFCHSGAEANEAALKLVRKAAGPKRYKIITFSNCFHGRTMGALSLTPPSFQEGFEPMLPGNVFLEHGDLSAVRSVIDGETAGIFVEPIQGEGGVNVPSREFMQGLREICDEHGLLLVCDEVWTAPARTGEWFGYQLFGIEPDVVSLGKSVGGGLPLAGIIVGERWADVLGPGSHGCTLGGNPLCAAAGLAALTIIEEEDLCARARILEETARVMLEALEGCEFRGSGAMIGIQLPERIDVRAAMTGCREAGVLVGPAKQNVLRLAPALTIDMDLWKEGLKTVREVISANL